MKRGYDVKANQVNYKKDDCLLLYDTQRKKGQFPKQQSPWEGPCAAVERLTDVTNFEARKDQAEDCSLQPAVEVSRAGTLQLGFTGD